MSYPVGPQHPREKCSECLGCPPHHAPSCSRMTQAERDRVEEEYQRWYGGDDDA